MTRHTSLVDAETVLGEFLIISERLGTGKTLPGNDRSTQYKVSQEPFSAVLRHGAVLKG